MKSPKPFLQNILIFTTLLLGSVLFTSCDKNKNNPKGDIIGVLFDSCTGKPLIDKQIEYWQDPEDSDNIFERNFSEEKLSVASTDENGVFSLVVPKIPKSASIRIRNGQASIKLAVGEIWPDDNDLNIDTIYFYGFNKYVRITIENKVAFKEGDKLVLIYPNGFEVKIDSIMPQVGKLKAVGVIPVNFRSLVSNDAHPLSDRFFSGKAKVEWLLKGKESENKWFDIEAAECETSDTLDFSAKL